VEPEETAVARERLKKDVSAAETEGIVGNSVFYAVHAKAI
jgi:hypothetical protein